MLTAIIILGGACVLLTLTVHFTSNKNTRLSVDNRLMETRIESLQEKIDAMKAIAPDNPLTTEGIKEAVRYNGYYPREVSDGVLFKDDGFVYYIDTSRLPIVFINHHTPLGSDDFDIQFLKEAAHQISDELIMVKMDIEHKTTGITIRYFIAALDANNASFQDNLPKYLNILQDAKRQLADIHIEKAYEKNKEWEEEEQSAAPDPADRFQEQKKIFS